MTQLLKVKEIAERLRVNEKTIRRWVKEGVIPALRPTRGTLLFDMAQVDEAIAKTTARLSR